MRTAFWIFCRDLKRLFTNWVAIIIIFGVCALPSLYAWFNIYANMDPYGNTQSIAVAVANCDTGGSNETMTLDAGAEVVESLKENDQLGWTFVDSDTAISGVKSGEYYAAIIIPEDFSSSLLSITDGDLKRPQLEYYINEKKNAVAPKITATGAGTIQQEINDTFSAVAASTICEIVERSVSDISTQVDSLNGQLVQILSDADNNLASYETSLSDFNGLMEQIPQVISDTNSTLDQAADAADSSSDKLDSALEDLNEARVSVGTFTNNFITSLTDSRAQLSRIYSNISLSLNDIENTVADANSAVAGGLGVAQSLSDRGREILESMQELYGLLPDGSVKDNIGQFLSQLQEKSDNLNSILSYLSSGNENLSDTEEALVQARETIEGIVADSSDSADSLLTDYNTIYLPSLNSSMDSLASAAGRISGALSNVRPMTQQLKVILSQLDASISDAGSALASTKDSISSVRDKISGIKTDFLALQSSEAYGEFLSLEGIDNDAVSDFMSSPVTVETEVLYDVENYGSSMTPFYTNLAIWVGSLILINIIKQEVDKDENTPKLTAASAYFGRWLLFVVLGLAQSVIVCVGDILLLGVQCLHPGLFILSGLVCAFVYANIIFSLSITLKHIGKALCVLLVILQIPGSSGTYPIEMTPAFFQGLHPLLPFTYGINSMREAVAGLYGFEFSKDLGILLAYVPLALFIGLVLRPLMMNLNYMFDKKLAESELMVCETNTPRRRTPKAGVLLNIMLGEGLSEDELPEKIKRFENAHLKRARRGFLLIMLLPLPLLIFAFSVEAKPIFLILWILSLLILAIYLIVMEYVHTRMHEDLSLSKMTKEEIINMFRNEGRDEKHY